MKKINQLIKLILNLLSFISLQAKNSLGFDLLVRRQVESNICQNIDNLDTDYLVNSYSNVFYLPMLIVFNILDKIFFKKFLSSSLYKKYISEIKINSEQSTNTNSRIKIESHQIKKTSLKETELHYRPNASNMQFGKIDSTGRFVSHFRNNDDAWSLDDSDDFLNKNQNQSGIKLKFDKLINMLPLSGNKHTNEEMEMAEQMAAMLVSEVVSQNHLP